MSYNVFYMNPGATVEICEMVRRRMPQGWRLLTSTDDADFVEPLQAADFIIAATEPIRAEHLELAPRLKMIQHQGVGFEKIDLEACRRRGIPVGLTPEGTSVGVAEHTLLLILAVYKRLVTAARGMAIGQWMQWSLRQDSFELCGKVLGLVGYGRIGREVAKRALAFDARIIYYDSYVANHEVALAQRVDSLDQLLATADVVSLHVPLTQDTRHLINAKTISRMKPGSVLINTARGELVDERALVAALENRHLGGAGLDVFESEPLTADHPLLRLPNVITTPHIAAGTRDAFDTKMEAVFANLVRYTTGEPLRNLVPEQKQAAFETN